RRHRKVSRSQHGVCNLHANSSLSTAPFSIAFVTMAPANYCASTCKRRVTSCDGISNGTAPANEPEVQSHSQKYNPARLASRAFHWCWRRRKTIVGQELERHCNKRVA
ncbi:hypothetical protein HaLaN_05477, partial [Haematococcus lacustris]